MKIELSNDEIKGILYAIERSDAREILCKLNQNNTPASLGLYSAEYKLNKLRNKINKQEA
tara:strand:- start:1549 stop:1728 length:180 start_codon:yes stop_codon:yes gene_type:complete